MKSDSVCRICLEKGEMKSIFTNCLGRLQMSCAEAISKISTITISEDDDFPKTICKKCLNKLKVAYKFKTLCEDSYMKLLQRSHGLNDALVKSEMSEDVNDRLSSDNECADIDLNECFHTKNKNYDNCNMLSKEKNQIKKSMKTKTDLRKDDMYHDKSFNTFAVGASNECLAVYKLNTNSYNINRNSFSSKVEEITSKERLPIPVDSLHSEKIECGVCNKMFNNTYELQKHNSIHNTNEPYFCETCQKSFNSEKSHRVIHERDRKFQCEICAKVFLRAATLRMHILGHKNELPFRCTYSGCEKAFPLNSRLKLHMKVHTNERNFICHYCSHAARDKQQLTVHIRYFHTKEKNYLCGTCGKGFVSTQARYYHAKRHENIRNHHCPHCGKSFVFAFGLQEHLLTHTGEKRFACSLCESRFSRKAHKISHEMRIHGVKKTV